jgi:hypothetical protein
MEGKDMEERVLTEDEKRDWCNDCPPEQCPYVEAKQAIDREILEDMRKDRDWWKKDTPMHKIEPYGEWRYENGNGNMDLSIDTISDRGLSDDK